MEENNNSDVQKEIKEKQANKRQKQEERLAVLEPHESNERTNLTKSKLQKNTPEVMTVQNLEMSVEEKASKLLANVETHNEPYETVKVPEETSEEIIIDEKPNLDQELDELEALFS